MKRLITSLLLLAVIALCAPARAATTVWTFLDTQTTTTAVCSATRAVTSKSWDPLRSFMASGTTSASTGAATVVIYGSMLGTDVWVPLGTITLTLATTVTFGTGSDGFTTHAPWPFLCAQITAISGTGAAVSVIGSAQ